MKIKHLNGAYFRAINIKRSNMIPDRLKEEFNSSKSLFDELKKQIEKNVVKVENYKGEFYEIAPYSYQRGGFKQGKIVRNVSTLKTTNNLYTYSFNAENKIIEVREGCELKDQFDYIFLFYEKDFMKTIAYDNSGKSSVRCPLKPKRFYPLKIFNNAPSKSLDRWGYYYFSLFPSVCRHLPDTFSV